MTRENVNKGLIEINTLSEEIECLMCLDTINDARMCIHCSAMVCAKCIENWLNRSKICPKCSHTVELKDFVRCRLANKLIDLLETTNNNKNICSIHLQETTKIFCITCQIFICSKCLLINNEHINHDYDNSNEDYRQICILNNKLLDFIRKRYKENQDNLKTIELATEILLNDHNENIEIMQKRDLLINETQHLFDEYQQKKQIFSDAIKEDELIINDIEQRLMRSKYLSDQEDILQILQRHIPSTI